VLVTLGTAAIAIAHLADRAVFLRVHHPEAATEDWARALRITGFVPTWLVIAAAMALIDRRAASFAPPLRDRWTRAATLSLAPILGGLLAEACKLLIRRERTTLPDATFAFRPFTEAPWSTSGLGMPSSHVAVAAAAAAILCRLHPSAWPVWTLLVIGCAITRIISRGHVVSETVAGALVGIAAAAIVWSLHLRTLTPRTTEATP
jgi:membrane-associated phospholipid phosphatase